MSCFYWIKTNSSILIKRFTNGVKPSAKFVNGLLIQVPHYSFSKFRLIIVQVPFLPLIIYKKNEISSSFTPHTSDPSPLSLSL